MKKYLNQIQNTYLINTRDFVVKPKIFLKYVLFYRIDTNLPFFSTLSRYFGK